MFILIEILIHVIRCVSFQLNTTEIVLWFLSIFFISASSLVLNDYIDIESNNINAPERPLPAGLVTERDVVLISILVTMLGFITGYLIS
jgi:geranylgeranylglycerol-phosphate geranylgeranyltransferase